MNKLTRTAEFSVWNKEDNANLKGVKSEDIDIYAERYGYCKKDIQSFIKYGYRAIKGMRRGTTRKERFSLVEGQFVSSVFLARKYSETYGIKIISQTYNKIKRELQVWPHKTAIKPWADIEAKKQRPLKKSVGKKSKLDRLWGVKSIGG